MSTTALIIEILVSGLFASLWLVLLLLKIYGVDLEQINLTLETYQEYSNVMIIIGFAVSYQLGWMINYLSYSFVGLLVTNRIRKRIFSDLSVKYTLIKNFVFEQANDEFIQRLRRMHSVVRLARAAVLNFFILAVILLIYHQYFLSAVTLVISFICLLQVRVEYKLYYGSINYFYTENGTEEIRSMKLDSTQKPEQLLEGNNSG